ncbi:Uncharacterized protein PECH_007723 [Penicillium ucsense]|uniref:Uncharacterized protein n=1 Tax=Penicillium ucsense TaxID=2839758 RepID=A0A8J8W3S8_9EURO|nr:Uncharacterized protein PECM_007881 [Penicillium ucsense]KAF7734713.1 Uncharacterized protein PECH_007723 [Penicillium ucsense]
MRLHLVISRHGLPPTRILWTTSSSSTLGEYGSHQPATASMVASSHTPNIAFANGGYTIAQLLEDVNEVVPLETEPTIFDPEFSGQWGLEDYVVEVGGSECLHFMEVDGLLRDGDEVVIRALQLADLRARRICGRHQITGDGKHLIDGVPFGMPFYKRTTSSRPAITIPPRKKRRTAFSGWDQGPTYEDPGPNVRVQRGHASDEEWLPQNPGQYGKELSVLPADHEISDMGTVIRHPVNYSGNADEAMDEDSGENSYRSDSDEEADIEYEADELEDELKALKEEFEISEPRILDTHSQPRESSGPSLRPSSIAKRPLSSESQGKSSLVGASSFSSKHSAGPQDSSPRMPKAVRFNGGAPRANLAAVGLTQEEEDSSSSSSSESSSDSEDAEDEEDPEVSSDEDSPPEDMPGSSSAESDTSSTSSTSEDDKSESEDDSVISKKTQSTTMNPPGKGSTRTKKSNMRFKLRRRLSKLKELKILPEEADFAALREWEEKNGGWHLPEDTSILSASTTAAQRKEDEQREFEARREKLLRDLASGGVDVDGTSEKQRKQPQRSGDSNSVERSVSANAGVAGEVSNPRKLDIESSRRMLFGSLGVRTPKTEEDVEATRRKLAAQASTVHSRKAKAPRPPVEEMNEESDGDDDWENKLVIKAVECIHDDIVLTAPPFPFVQRWDKDANELIRQRNGWGKKRKRKQRVQVYEEDEHGEYDDHDHDASESHMLNYDSEWPTAEDETAQAADHQVKSETSLADDLPPMPADPSSLADLSEKDTKIGAIIAFKQLDMSKATNWQPVLSGYRVAEIHEVHNNGEIKIRLAARDRRPKPKERDPEDEEPRAYIDFEMPGMEEDDEDDGYREVDMSELAEPKLLRTAALDISDVGGDQAEENDKSGVFAREGSTVSIVEDSMPNNQPASSPSSPIEMDLDETTYVTLETAASRLPSLNGSPARATEAASSRTPTAAAARLRVPRGRYADDEYSESPAVPSPNFSGFHSARSSPGTSLGPRYHELGDSGLDGHTLVGEQSMLAVGHANHDMSALSFTSANQSFSNTQQDSTPQDRQVVDNSHISASNETLVSMARHTVEAAETDLTKSSPAPSVSSRPSSSSEEQQSERPTPTQNSSMLELLESDCFNAGDTEAEREVEDDDDDDDEEDSVLHSNQSPDLSSQPSPRPHASAQHGSHPSPSLNDDSLRQYGSPATSTRSKHPQHSFASQLSVSQVSEVIDLTEKSSPGPLASHSSSPQRPTTNGIANDDQSSTSKATASSSKIQEMAEVAVSPGLSQKAKKKKKIKKKERFVSRV